MAHTVNTLKRKVEILSMESNDRMLKAALAYGRRLSWSIFPVGGCGGKRPKIDAWQKRATTDEATISAWWGDKFPGANIGVVTSARSGLVALDVDPRHGGDDSLAELEARHGKLPHTVKAITGGGGRHILFRHAGQLVKNSAGKLGVGLDVRGDGGFIVVPPSLHLSGNRYEWDGVCHPLNVELAPWPSFLSELLRDPHSTSDECSGQYRAKPSEHWRELVASEIAEGGRNAALAALAGHLLRRYVDPYVVLSLCHAWNERRCRPPLPPSEVIRTVNSIAGMERRREKGGAHV